MRGRHRGRRPSRADPGHAGEARGAIRITATRPSYDVVVVGGGLIGLGVAWRASARGLSVCVLDRGALGRGASHVAAGMLAPVAEAAAGERPLLEAGIASARLWPDFAAELEEISGADVGYRRCGALLVARDNDDAAWLEREHALRKRFELDVERLLPSAARRLEPALAPTVRLALDLRDDHIVDPRRVTHALARAAHGAGAVLHAGVEVVEVRPGKGVVARDGRLVAAEQVVVAAGPWSGIVEGVPMHARVPVRPVKGQTVRLLDPSDGAGALLERVVRFDGGYVAPRGDGRYVVGGTVEERGFDTAITAGAAYELLRDAAEIVPGVLELEVEELVAGLRPGTPDNAPILGRGAVDGLVWATGHYRNGVLLTPLTADLVAAELAHEPVEHAFGPERFAGSPPAEPITAGAAR